MTRDTILSYHDARINLIENAHNEGLPRSLNRALRAAKGEYIARQDSDDISEIERLTRQVTYLDAHPDVALLGSWYTEINAEGAVIGKRQLPCDTTEIRWCLSFYCPFVHSAVMFRSAVLLGTGLYDEAFPYAQDYDLWCRIARQAPVANLDEHLTRFRISPTSMTATWGATTLQEPFQISLTYVRELCGSDPETIDLDPARLGRMTALLYGSEVDFLPKEAERQISFILFLQQAFCRYYHAGREGHVFRQKLRAHLAARLLSMASYSLDRDNRIASRQFFFAACQLQWITLLLPDAGRLLLKLLMGRRLVAWLRSQKQSLENREP
jgi:hypothetical protein